MNAAFSTLAEIRFGYGLSPMVAAPRSVDAMLARLAGPDVIATRFPIEGFRTRAAQERALGILRKARRTGGASAQTAFRKANRRATRDLIRDFGTSLIRPMLSPDGFRERLLRFWADHFTVAASGKGLRYVTTGYIEDAIRPYMTGNFATLLKSASLHPAMLIYLDQVQSIGPNSRIGKRLHRGLNENLAREMLELHTMGVNGAYTQKDVRQLAKLLTGLYYNFRTGFKYRAAAAEPGVKTVLGHEYGGLRGQLSDIHAFLDDLAMHPDTAQNIAHKLAVHFIADKPDPGMVQAISRAYLESGGALMECYRAMLEHPAAWQGFGSKAKQPFDYMVSTLRALGVEEAAVAKMPARRLRQVFATPMQIMGQPWLRPGGPNGWPEQLDAWITPQAVAARIEWALMISAMYGKGNDPRDLARVALAEQADPRLVAVLGAAESRAEGVALFLSAPEFNRR